MKVYMTVSGFEEALGSAQLVELREDLQVKVASLAGLTILKLFAWGIVACVIPRMRWIC